MSKNRPEPVSKTRLTPWVGRLMLGQAVVFVLLKSVFTAPIFTEVLRFVPDQALHRPWTFLSYMFVHQGLLSLGGNLLLLFAFGPAVERRFGSRDFLLYYFYCGLGAAAFALGLTSIMTVPAMVGATGAALGVTLAFAFSGSDTRARLLPSQINLSARSLIVLLACANLVLALWVAGGVAHLGYLGGLAAGYVFFRIQSLAGRRQRNEPKSIVRRPVMAPMPVRQGGTVTDVRPALARPEPREEYPAEEVDRVLDKISAFGIQSLTADERRFLDEASKRKRKDTH
jgi:rhomboid family protein